MGGRKTLCLFLLLCCLLEIKLTEGQGDSGNLGSSAANAGKCENTVGGRWFVADDRGVVCSRDKLDYATGCCTGGEPYTCESCSLADRCCSQYEQCVSCCLKPQHAPEKLMQKTYKGMNKPETGLWTSAFEYCRAKCRTTSRSTQHENAFILSRRFCFSKLGRPRVPEPPGPPLPKSTTVRVGGDGQSCDQACAGKGGVCTQAAMASLNNCNTLREHFMCEAGCGPADPGQHEFPGYVVSAAPKNQWPAFCGTLSARLPGAAPEFRCNHTAPGTKRLCPCEPAPPPLPTAVGGQAAGMGQQATAGGVQQPAQQAAAAAQSASQQAQQQQPQQHEPEQQQQQQGGSGSAGGATGTTAAVVQNAANIAQAQTQQA